MIYRIDWQTEVSSDFLTMPAVLEPRNRQTDPQSGRIDLSWLDVNASFKAAQLPIQLGRVTEADFIVNDPRVSRLHARIEWRHGTFVLVDLSSYGTWVRFGDSGTEMALRREECALHGTGDMALGAPFSDFTVPTVSFSLVEGTMELAHRAGQAVR